MLSHGAGQMGQLPVDQHLLQIIAHIHSKNKETSLHSAIATDKIDPILSSALKWLDNDLHAMVEKIGHAAAMGSLIFDVVEF
jgi:hypothetical protein